MRKYLGDIFLITVALFAWWFFYQDRGYPAIGGEAVLASGLITYAIYEIACTKKEERRREH